MKKFLFPAFIISVWYTGLAAQQTPPATLFSKAFGGTDFDQATCIAKTSDGGYVIAGSTHSIDGDLLNIGRSNWQGDCMIMKISSAGTLQWAKVYGSWQGDRFSAIQQTTDGGYIAAGITGAAGGDVTTGAGGWLVKMNDDGDIQWQARPGADCHTVKQTADGGYITGGNNYISKFSGTGTLQWTYNLQNTTVTSLCQTSDGRYAAAGAGFNRGNDFRITILTDDGALERALDFGGFGDDDAHSIQPTADGGYIVAGRTTSNNDGNISGYHGGSDFWVIKLSGTLGLQWQKALGGTGYETAYNVIQTSDGGYVLVGEAQSTDGGTPNTAGDYNGWVVKLNAAGGLVWEKYMGGSETDQFRSVLQNTDGSYTITGFTMSGDGGISGFHQGPNLALDAWLVKLGADAVNTLPQSFSSATQNSSGTQPVVFTNSEGLLIAAIIPGGASPVSGNTTAKVWVETAPLTGFVNRHYEITPDNNAANASARITLYYTQEEFTSYNLTKANFRIVKYSGTSSDGTGMPGTYPGPPMIIDPDDNDIVWNGAANRWEVSFAVTGFSGFFATDAAAVLPVTFGAISAFIKGEALTVNWTTVTETGNAYYLIEASADGKNFTAISGKIFSKAQDGTSFTALQYRFTKSYSSVLKGMALLFLFTITGYRKRKLFPVLGVAAICCFLPTLSCKKNTGEISYRGDQKIHIRIVQVDKDGSKNYSKIIAVTNGE